MLFFRLCLRSLAGDKKSWKESIIFSFLFYLKQFTQTEPINWAPTTCTLVTLWVFIHSFIYSQSQLFFLPQLKRNFAMHNRELKLRGSEAEDDRSPKEICFQFRCVNTLNIQFSWELTISTTPPCKKSTLKNKKWKLSNSTFRWKCLEALKFSSFDSTERNSTRVFFSFSKKKFHFTLTYILSNGSLLFEFLSSREERAAAFIGDIWGEQNLCRVRDKSEREERGAGKGYLAITSLVV